MERLYQLLQLSYGLPQSLLGFLFFIINIKEKHYLYHGIVVSEWRLKGSISLGLFIFLEKGAGKKLLVHEFGHTVQSAILGPLYLLIIGLPSLIWCAFYKPPKHYTAFFSEKWADELGVKYLKQDALETHYKGEQV